MSGQQGYNENLNEKTVRNYKNMYVRDMAIQDESLEYMTVAYKKQIIVLLDMVDNGDLMFLKQIYTIIKARVRRLEKIGRYTN